MPLFGKLFSKPLAAPLAAALAALVFIGSTAAPTRVDTAAASDSTVVETAVPAFSRATVSDDVLWIARCIYSETKRPEEQELVAWVVRNRVETRYRRRSDYERVVLDPLQFSAFNHGSSKRNYFMSLTPDSNAPGWHRALEIAHNVYYAPVEERPFPVRTRHFYSERSMVGGASPNWARGRTPVQPTRYRIDPRRFRFYAGIS